MKHGKKTNYQLKFDTSKKNLQCFIKRKSMSICDNDKNDKKRKSSQPKSKSLKKKPQQFQQLKFMETIIKNVMQQQFEDEKQVREMLNTMQIQSEQKIQSPTNEDDLLKSFQIFKEPSQRFTPEIKSYSNTLNCNNKEFKNLQQDKFLEEKQIQLGKEFQWNNFSTQIGTEIGTERSKRESILQQYPPLIQSQYSHQSQLKQDDLQKLYYQCDNFNMMDSSLKDQKQRRSTPIRGEAQQFRIRLDKVENDGRTTVMIRHIPNKYSQQMLIDEINVNHKNKYNFFYLPVDSYNPCNVGYAFINFIDTKFIGKFYLQFNGKRWNQFNSDKICMLAYARIQGSKALMNHFQNSNVMHSRDRRISKPFISFGDNYNSNR